MKLLLFVSILFAAHTLLRRNSVNSNLSKWLRSGLYGSTTEISAKASTIQNDDKVAGRYPYVAYIYLDKEDLVWRCGGTLIAQDVVLTAAHCLPKSGTFSGSVTLGGYESYNNEPQENFKINSIVKHPRFSWIGYPDNDVAIVKLDRCSGVQPITLKQPGGTQLIDNEVFTVLGWEDTLDDQGYEKETTIQESRVRYNKQCEPWRSRKTLGNMTESMLCTSLDERLSKRVIPKRGDSGGALLIKGQQPKDDVQIGVVSFGYDKPGRKTPVPTVYASVESTFSWILQARNAISQCSTQNISY